MTQQMVIFDIDGTLADTTHRNRYIQVPEGQKKDWDSFFGAQHLDPVRMDVVRVLDMYHQYPSDVHVALLTGRGEEHREVTEAWLEKYRIEYHSLTMRPLGDRTDDHFLKLAQIKAWQDEGFEIIGFYDDRKRICDAARAHGITVFQMAEGDF